ncbi:DoxX family protein [Ideonella oryzae]|uniref:DoxX family protein n=1 Tax=Ideonella oryzae TaxID=2937441 RepID=UPI003F491014
MRMLGPVNTATPATLSEPAWLGPLRWLGLLALCAAYLQGGLSKAWDLSAATAEMAHFGLQPAGPMALAVIVFELVASLAVLTGWQRAPAALALGAFTLAASVIANPFWSVPADSRPPLLNAFMEHLGLAGAWGMVALASLRHRQGP